MNKVIKKIGIWGDSILKGVIFDEVAGKYQTTKKCAVNLFKRVFKSVDIKNNSRFGCTAPKAAENLERSLAKGFSADVVLLEFGGNDCDFNWQEVSRTPDEEHEPNTPMPQFIDSMKYMVDKLLGNGITPVLMNLPPISSERYFDWISHMPDVNGENVLRWLKEKEVIYRQQECYSHAIEKIAHEYRLNLIDVREPFLRIRDYKNYLCLDGIHLNENGQRILCDTLKKYASDYDAKFIAAV